MNSLDFASEISSSFEAFMTSNKISPLTREELAKWDFPSEILPKLNQSNLPSLSSLLETKKPILIQGLFTVQNIIENQMYLAAKFDHQSKKYIINKYYEYHNENNFCGDGIDFNSETSLLCDRLALEVVDVDGLNEKMKVFYPQVLSSQKTISKIIIYDYTNTHSKLNKIIKVIGPAYIKENDIVIHAWKIIDNPLSNISSLFPHTIIDDTNILNTMNQIFLAVFNGDELATEYAKLFMFSKIFVRKTSKNIGVLPINFQLVSKNSSIYDKFISVVNKLALYSLSFNLSIDFLNTNRLYPRFDVEQDTLIQGKLQVCDGTFVTVNETTMNEGKLEDIGIRNYATIKSIIDFQTINYEYPYNTIEMPHDIEIAIFTEGKKSLFDSVFLVQLPVQETNPNINSDIFQNEKAFDDAFVYINSIRTNEKFLDFKISNEVSDMINKDYLGSIKGKFNADEFDLVMRLSRLRAISMKRNEMLFEDYVFCRDLEAKRKERITKGK